jgi:hypothetical protein
MLDLTKKIEALDRFDLVGEYADVYIGHYSDGEFISRNEVLQIIKSTSNQLHQLRELKAQVLKLDEAVVTATDIITGNDIKTFAGDLAYAIHLAKYEGE